MGLPFTGEEVPNILLDILRGCNVRCRACYNTGTPLVKTVEEVLGELTIARSFRRLDCVTLLGGEPLLHPHLLDIIRAIKAQGLKVAVFTNGLVLDLPTALDFKAAGVELVVVHLEEGQERSDFKSGSRGDVRRLREEKLALLAKAGLEAGLAITAMPGCEREVADAVDLALASPDLSFLLVTLFLDTSALPRLAGDIYTGIRAVEPSSAAGIDRSRRIREVRELMEGKLGEPFLVHHSLAGDPRWFSHLVATVHGKDGSTRAQPLRPTWIEPALSGLLRKLRGRHFFYQPQRRPMQYLHMVLNGLAGGGLRRNLGMVLRSLEGGPGLRMKRILLQVPANLDDLGNLVYCQDCPDAVVRHGALVPVCVSDQMVDPRVRA